MSRESLHALHENGIGETSAECPRRVSRWNSTPHFSNTATDWSHAHRPAEVSRARRYAGTVPAFGCSKIPATIHATAWPSGCRFHPRHSLRAESVFHRRNSTGCWPAPYGRPELRCGRYAANAARSTRRTRLRRTPLHRNFRLMSGRANRSRRPRDIQVSVKTRAERNLWLICAVKIRSARHQQIKFSGRSRRIAPYRRADDRNERLRFPATLHPASSRMNLSSAPASSSPRRMGCASTGNLPRRADV